MPASRRRAFAVALLFLASAGLRAQAPPDVVEKIKSEGSVEKSRVMDHLSHLCLKIGPRLTGSQRLIQAAEWAADTFRGFGLTTRLDQWDEIAVGFDRGTHSGFAFFSEGDNESESRPARTQGRRLNFNTNSWTAGTNGLQTGPAVIVPDDAAALPSIKDAAKGAWLFRVPGSVGRKALTEFAQEAGALGVVAGGGDLLLTGGDLRTKWDNLPKLPSIQLWDTDYKFLIEKLKANVAVTLSFDVQNYFRKGPVPVYNVIAELKGTEKPDELVIVGGHLDSWDGAQGTTDNGTGTATTIEAARILTAVGAKPRRTIRFMLWSGEEQGLLGSNSYIKRHPEENERISAVLVHDGGTNYVSGIPATAAMKADFEAVFAPVFALNPEFPFKVREVGRLPQGIGSDHDSYVRIGVPGFFWSQSGRANYTYTHHTQHDVLAAAIPEYQRHTSMVVAIGALGIANLPEKLSRAVAESRPDAPNPMRARRRLGVVFDEEMVVSEVMEEGRGKAAGIKEGDRILKVDGRPVKDRREMSDELNAGEAKKVVTVKRGNAEVEISIDFAAQ
jgi:carboxypeptidase Q